MDSDYLEIMIKDNTQYSYSAHYSPAFYSENRFYICANEIPHDVSTDPEFQICRVDYINSINQSENNIKSSNLISNYPNPFNPATTINYTINEPSDINISVYNSNGEFIREIYNGYKANGNHSIKFDGSNLNSGIYYTILKANGNKSVKKMVLVK